MARLGERAGSQTAGSYVQEQQLIESLRASFDGALFSSPEDVAAYVVDWRRVWVGACLAVAEPSTVEGVAAVVRWCAHHNVAVVPQGGNTGLSGGATPATDGRSVVLSTRRLRRIRNLDAINRTITVDAGCVLADVQQAALDAGLLFPLSLAAEGSCTIGGNLATNAGGTAVLRYGNARALCLGIEVVTAAGELWAGLRGLRKDNTGYDLRDVFIGSEGTLGVITGAVLQLFPRPVHTQVVLVAVADPSRAVQLFSAASGCLGAELTACELISSDAIALVERYSPVRSPFRDQPPWVVLLQAHTPLDDVEEFIRAQMEDEGNVVDAVVARSTLHQRQFWALRESVSEAQGAAGPTIKHDISVPLSEVARFLADADRAVRGIHRDVHVVAFGHLGDGNIHYNLSPPTALEGATLEGAALEDFTALTSVFNAAVHNVVRNCGGSISAEHGLGVLRRDEADRFRSPVERSLMQAIKRALDPTGIMNPGKVIPNDLSSS